MKPYLMSWDKMDSKLVTYTNECLKSLLDEESSVNKPTAYWIISRFFRLTPDEYKKYIKPYEKEFEKEK